MSFCRIAFAGRKVAVVPGSAFGPSGQGHIRISYATSMENLKEAMQRMSFFVKSTYRRKCPDRAGFNLFASEYKY